MWFIERQNQLIKNINHIFDESNTRSFCFLNPTVLNGDNSDGVFNPTYFNDINSIITNDWTQLSLTESYDQPCIYIITAHGSDISSQILNLRAKCHLNSIYCIWHFDNHIAHFNNYKTAISCDFNFISHNAGVHGYLTNPISPIVSHIPACCVQFGISEIKECLTETKNNERISKGLFNYVIYEDAPRSRLINQLNKDLEDIGEFKLMPSIDRSRYWKMSRKERILEWAKYKCSVIIPLASDLSTRVFDSLATGQIPIIPESILDLDNVIPYEVQSELGIIKIKDLSTTSVREGILAAINNFNKFGLEGVFNRTQYILENATNGHRISKILESMYDLHKGKCQLIFGNGINGCGSYINHFN